MKVLKFKLNLLPAGQQFPYQDSPSGRHRYLRASREAADGSRGGIRL